MITVEQLREYGADVDDGLQRCLNNEAFYLRLVNKAMQDDSFAQLQEAVEKKELDRAFEKAHALKGVMANLALEPICRPIREITELLRNRTDTDYSALLAEIAEKKNELTELLR